MSTSIKGISFIFLGGAELDKGTGKATVVEHECGLSGTSELKRVTVEGGNEPHIRIQVKDKSKVRSVEMISPENTSDTRPYKKRMTVTYGNGSINLEDETFGAKATKTFEKASSQLADDRSVKSNNKILDVTRRPDAVSPESFVQFQSLSAVFILKVYGISSKRILMCQISNYCF